MEYINILIIFAIIPALITLYFTRNSVVWRAFVFSTFVAGVLGIIAVYIGLHRNLWFFSKEESKMIGVWFRGVPLEDFIFVIVVPALIIGTYEFAKKYLAKTN